MKEGIVKVRACRSRRTRDPAQLQVDVSILGEFEAHISFGRLLPCDMHTANLFMWSSSNTRHTDTPRTHFSRALSYRQYQ